MRERVYQADGTTAASALGVLDATSMGQPESLLREDFLLEALRRGDEDAYALLLQRYYKPMLRRALLYVTNQAVAEEVVQDTWMGIFQGVHRFEGKCALYTWMLTILIRCAQTRSIREKRCIPFSSLSLSPSEMEENDTSVDETMSQGISSSQDLGSKMLFYQERFAEPEAYLLAKELLTSIEWALNLLPLGLRRIMKLRVIEGWTSEEVYLKYHITEANQRVLLHRARTRIRSLLEHATNERQTA